MRPKLGPRGPARMDRACLSQGLGAGKSGTPAGRLKSFVVGVGGLGGGVVAVFGVHWSRREKVGLR